MDDADNPTFSPADEFVRPQDSGWGMLTQLADATGRDQQRARAETLQHSTLTALAWGDAQAACWYLARSLGAARRRICHRTPGRRCCASSTPRWRPAISGRWQDGRP